MKEKFEDWEGWYFHHLSRRAKVFGLKAEYVNILENAGWITVKEGQIPISIPSSLIESLETLASIKNFSKTCEDKNCKVCKILVETFKKNTTENPWKLPIEPYRWQKEAKKVWWESNCKGIVKVVTGAGKTILALSLISDMFNSESFKEGGLRAIIIVPTSVLLDQWLVEIQEKLNIPRDEIGIFHGKKKDNLTSKKIIIYVVNSARTHLISHYTTYFRNDDLFLIADECHRYGSKENSKIFSIPFSFKLGLSATPERQGDYGFEEKIIPNLGNVIYSYTYTDALNDGIIPPYKIVNIKVQLLKEEGLAYDEISKKIKKLSGAMISKYPQLKHISRENFLKEVNKLYSAIGDDLLINYMTLLNKRKSIIHLSRSKLIALKWILNDEMLYNDKILIFHERIEVAEIIFDYLREKEFQVGIYHSEMNADLRLKNITNFKKGELNVLVACKALDEGFDVPNADTGIIVAGTSSVRQWIQRMGRILRKSPGKEFSKIYLIFADVVERDVFNEKELYDFEKEALSVEMVKLTTNKKI